jgi:hypothetical protein
MSKIDDIRTYIRNAYGLSDEDVTNLIRMVSEIVAEQMPPDVATKEYVTAYVDGSIKQLRTSFERIDTMLENFNRDMERARRAVLDE